MQQREASLAQEWHTHTKVKLMYVLNVVTIQHGNGENIKERPQFKYFVVSLSHCCALFFSVK